MNNVIRSFTMTGKVYSLEKRADNLYIVRVDGKTKDIYRDIKEADLAFNNLEKFRKGGEKTMPEKKVEETIEQGKIEETAVVETPKNNAVVALPEEYFKKNANVGLTDLGQEDIPIPSLSVVQSSSKMVDLDGRPYAAGKLYYKALKAAYDNVNCHILTITKRMSPSYTDPNQMERTYVMLGVIVPNNMPFIMYCRSTSIGAARNFIGEVKARQFPMYALNVQITTKSQSNDKGSWYVPVFNIVGDLKDADKVVALENLAKEYEEMREMLKSEEEVTPHVKPSPSQAIPADVVDPTDIPF